MEGAGKGRAVSFLLRQFFGARRSFFFFFAANDGRPEKERERKTALATLATRNLDTLPFLLIKQLTIS